MFNRTVVFTWWESQAMPHNVKDITLAESLREAPAIPVATDADPSEGSGRGRGRPRGTDLTHAYPSETRAMGAARSAGQ
jgi:hypothetical protein